MITKTAKISLCKKFRLLVWKNVWIVVNNKKQYMATIGLTLFIIFYLIICRLKVKVDVEGLDAPQITRLELDVERLDLALRVVGERYEFIKAKTPKAVHSVYVPQQIFAYSSKEPDIYNEFEAYAKRRLPHLKAIIRFDTCEALRSNMSQEHYFAGVCIEEHLPDLEYELVFPSERRKIVGEEIDDGWETGLEWEKLTKDKRNRASDEGLLGLTILVSSFLVERHKPQFIVNEYIYLAPLPHRYNKKDPILLDNTIKFSETLFFVYLPATLFIYYLIICEKENATRVLLKLNGFSSNLQDLAWAFVLFLISLVVSLLLVIALKIKWNNGTAIYTFTTFSILYIFFTFYSIANSMFCIMIVGCCENSKYAVRIIFKCSILSLIIYPTQFCTLESLYMHKYLLLCLSHVSTIEKLSLLLGISERYFQGTRWSDFKDELWPKQIILAFVVNTVLYYLVGRLISDFFPGAYNKRFEGLKNFWKLIRRKKKVMTTFDYYKRMSSETSGRQSTEKVSVHLCAANLSKKYKNNQILSDISFEVQRNEVFVIFGANGSGKSSLCKILGGIIESDSGSVYLNDINLIEDRTSIVSDIGIAFGDEFLFEDLTVHQQIILHGSIKGVPKGYLLERVLPDLLEELNLKEVEHSLTRALSLNQRNTLALACAFSGQNQIVILDSLEAHFDTSSKINLISFLLQCKKETTIILSTHSVNVAEMLSDRMLVLKQGRVVATGDDRCIKDLIEPGYNLSLVKLDDFTENHEKKIETLISKYLVGISMYNRPYRSNIELKISLEEEENLRLILKEMEENLLDFGLYTFELYRSNFYNAIKHLIGAKKKKNQSIETFRTNVMKQKVQSRLEKIKILYRSVWAMVMLHIWYNNSIKRLLLYLLFYNTLLFCLVYAEYKFEIQSNIDPEKIRMDLSRYKYSNLFVSVVYRRPKHAPNKLAAAAFWHYRDTAYDLGYTLCNTSLHIVDYFIEQMNSDRNMMHLRLLGGVEKYFDYSSKDTTHISLITYFSRQRRLAALANYNFVLQSFLQALGDKDYSVQTLFKPLEFQNNIDVYQASRQHLLSDVLAVMIVASIQFPYFVSYVAQEKFAHKMAYKLNDLKFFRYISSTLICFIPQLIALTAFTLLVIGYFSQIQLGVDKAFAILVTVPIFAIYCRYAFVVVDLCIKDQFIANLTICGWVIISNCNWRFNSKNEAASNTDFIWFISPLYIIASSLSTIITQEDQKYLCTYDHIYQRSVYLNHCKRWPNCCETSGALSKLQTSLIFMVSMIFVHFLLIYCIINFSILREGCHKFRMILHRRVVKERKNYNNTDVATPIEFDSVFKKTKGNMVLENLNFSVEKGEIFAVSTRGDAANEQLLRLVAKNIQPDSGTVSIFGNTMKYRIPESIHLGCSLMKVELNFRCTVGQYLRTYAAKTGMSSDEAHNIALYLLEALNIKEESMDIQLKHCSIGLQKMISVAATLIGCPQLIVLSSPVDGLDYFGQTDLMSLLMLYANNGGTIMLSASFDYHFRFRERVAYLDKGFLHIIQKKENNVAEKTGYVLKVKLKTYRFHQRPLLSARLNHKLYVVYANFIENNWPEAKEIREINQFVIHFIPIGTSNLSDIYEKIAKSLTVNNIEDFSIFIKHDEMISDFQI